MARMRRIRHAHRILMGNLCRRRSLERLKRGWDDNIKINLGRQIVRMGGGLN
jgi:hypothetical protein